MTLTGQKTSYYVARTKDDGSEDTLVRTNTFTGYPGGANGFDNADVYQTYGAADEMAKWLNGAPTFVKQDYDYYVIQKDEDSFRLDAEGNKVDVVEDYPTEEPTT
ncbi:hypothetical protein [Salinicoccus roseus]|uniref:Uncharacterized protein n=1 Tax=Salinicoccus roseus TaxID=45670 RepID=A0A0C2HE80_9STAP|nr:hypothetical protein [Salinicoccus roseus]KIH69949.1 hypothetical protein SN16_10585 [Salinicoccus roseus]MDB0581246.1 hypothetical protein [Salinicoccus roseus]